MRKFLMFVGLLALVVMTASPALAQPDPPGQAKAFKARAFQGVVVSVDVEGDSLVVDSNKFGEEVTVTVDGNTRYQVPGNKIADLSDIVAGDRVVVQLQKPPKNGDTEDEEQEGMLARRIHLIPAQIFTHYTGVIVSDVTGDTMTVKRAEDDTREFALDEEKTIVRDGNVFQRLGDYLDDEDGVLEEGMKVTVVARVDGEDYTAAAIVIHGNGPNGATVGSLEDEDDEDLDVDDQDVDEDEDDGGNNGRGNGRDNAPGQLKKVNSNSNK